MLLGPDPHFNKDPDQNPAPVSLIPVVHLDLRLFLRIFEKIRNGPNGIFGAGRKLIHEKNQKQKTSWHCPFKYSWHFYKKWI